MEHGGSRRGELLLLDSASLSDLERMSSLGLVSGVTTNPTLFRREQGTPLEQLVRLLSVADVRIYFQPSASSTDEARDELRRALALDPDRVVAKLPLSDAYLPLVREASDEDRPFAITAVYSLEQALVASQFGAGWIIPYVDRARRLMEGGDTLVGRLRGLLDRIGSPTRILAASIKSPEQAIASLLDGAHQLTLPENVLAALAGHPLTESAVEDFTRVQGD